MRIWNIMKCRRTAVLLMLFLVAVIALPMSLSCGPIELGATPGFTIDIEECHPFNVQFTSSNTTCPSPVIFYWLVGTLPPYANFDNVTGTLTGCPQVGDPSAIFVVGVSEFSPPACGPYLDMDFVTINVIPTASTCDMVIDPVWYPVAWEGLPYAMLLNVIGGVGPYEWSATGLPAGLSVTDVTNGVISGTPGPLTCGIYTVTTTVTDLGTCCCPAVNRDFVLYIDCWANYPPIPYGSTPCDFTVDIGSGLAQGQTNVMVDGSHEATLLGGQSQVLTSVPCESHLVMVDQTIQGSDPNMRFSVIGSNFKQVSNVDNYAFFDYAREVHIGTSSDPPGLTEPPGAGFYAVGSYFSSTAPIAVETNIQNGIKYVFREWQLPDGSKSPTREVLFTVNQAGTVTAQYDTYYQLTLHSEYPAINERSWERQGSTATWNLSLHAVPLPGFWGFLGGVQSPLNASGSQLITGPTTVEIQWRPNYTMPIVAIIIALLVIVGLIVLIVRLQSRGSAGTGDKKASSKAKESEDKSFCSKCGASVDKDADFCKKCGKKL